MESLVLIYPSNEDVDEAHKLIGFIDVRINVYEKHRGLKDDHQEAFL